VAQGGSNVAIAVQANISWQPKGAAMPQWQWRQIYHRITTYLNGSEGKYIICRMMTYVLTSDWRELCKRAWSWHDWWQLFPERYKQVELMILPSTRTLNTGDKCLAFTMALLVFRLCLTAHMKSSNRNTAQNDAYALPVRHASMLYCWWMMSHDETYLMW
jgi:hypothetical protein